MDRFNLRINKELLDRIKLLAKTYKVSTTKMINQLLSVGYLYFIKESNYSNFKIMEKEEIDEEKNI